MRVPVRVIVVVIVVGLLRSAPQQLPRVLRHPAAARTAGACVVMAAGALVVGRSALQL